MKIFDFTNSTKGTELANLKFDSLDHSRVDDVIYTFAPEQQIHGNHPTFHLGGTLSNGNKRSIEFNPQDLGVEAVVFCMGNFGNQEDGDDWHWEVIGTLEWARQAIENGVLVAKTQHHWEKMSAYEAADHDKRIKAIYADKANKMNPTERNAAEYTARCKLETLQERIQTPNTNPNAVVQLKEVVGNLELWIHTLERTSTQAIPA